MPDGTNPCPVSSWKKCAFPEAINEIEEKHRVILVFTTIVAYGTYFIDSYSMFSLHTCVYLTTWNIPETPMLPQLHLAFCYYVTQILI